VLEYTSLPDSTPERHAATIPGIKLSHLVHIHTFIVMWLSAIPHLSGRLPPDGFP